MTSDTAVRSEELGIGEDAALLARSGYVLGDELGSGSHSRVAVVTRDGLAYACKVVYTRRTSRNFRVKFLPRQLGILSRLRHSHIVRVLEILHRPSRVFIVMELVLGGNLFTLVSAEGRLSESRAHELFVQLACAVAYLHRHNIAHRDIKCENVLLSHDGIVKLADFGFSRYCGEPREAARSLQVAGGRIRAMELNAPRLHTRLSLIRSSDVYVTLLRWHSGRNRAHTLGIRKGRRAVLVLSLTMVETSRPRRHVRIPDALAEAGNERMFRKRGSVQDGDRRRKNHGTRGASW
ncbi:hypothetical protein HPB47_011056 [Ixodes persulcatus]|uniref:Uncharacterized protein n=1 Tax=Ixodes persulcatus TaxID=34615 RepID=A0AC60NXI4_IXOPE|nr:hypothetical protein HPB47_011056 [Ixodes persulcatus]